MSAFESMQPENMQKVGSWIEMATPDLQRCHTQTGRNDCTSGKPVDKDKKGKRKRNSSLVSV